MNAPDTGFILDDEARIIANGLFERHSSQRDELLSLSRKHIEAKSLYETINAEWQKTQSEFTVGLDRLHLSVEDQAILEVAHDLAMVEMIEAEKVYYEVLDRVMMPKKQRIDDHND